jgi:hypothetical protein
MSKQAVDAVLNKAITDSDFKNKLLTNPQDAFVGYDLTENEKSDLSTLTASNFNKKIDEWKKGQWIPGG